jgi:DNA-binding MarR family transcriptional regulator
MTTAEGSSTRGDASAQHVFHGILRVAEMFTRALTDALRPFQLTLSQYSVLQALRHTESEGLCCRDVGERLVSRDPDITRLLDRLEGRGFISRRREGRDRRVVRAQITEKGADLLTAIDAVVSALHARFLGHLGRPELTAFHELLEATVEHA